MPFSYFSRIWSYLRTLHDGCDYLQVEQSPMCYGTYALLRLSLHAWHNRRSQSSRPAAQWRYPCLCLGGIPLESPNPRHYKSPPRVRAVIASRRPLSSLPETLVSRRVCQSDCSARPTPRDLHVGVAVIGAQMPEVQERAAPKMHVTHSPKPKRSAMVVMRTSRYMLLRSIPSAMSTSA